MPVSLRRLGGWLLFGLLGAILGVHIVRSTAEMLTDPCPGADTVFQRIVLRTACPDDR